MCSCTLQDFVLVVGYLPCRQTWIVLKRPTARLLPFVLVLHPRDSLLGRGGLATLALTIIFREWLVLSSHFHDNHQPTYLLRCSTKKKDLSGGGIWGNRVVAPSGRWFRNYPQSQGTDLRQWTGTWPGRPPWWWRDCLVLTLAKRRRWNRLDTWGRDQRGQWHGRWDRSEEKKDKEGLNLVFCPPTIERLRPRKSVSWDLLVGPCFSYIQCSIVFFAEKQRIEAGNYTGWLIRSLRQEQWFNSSPYVAFGWK